MATCHNPDFRSPARPAHRAILPSMAELTHLNERGEASMVDVSGKVPSERHARARAVVRMAPATLRAIVEDGTVAKGDVLAVARIAGIQAAKRTSDLIPLCHPLPLAQVTVDFQADADALAIHTYCKVTGRTGVEMEALTAASVAALTVYDMCKALDRGMTIENVALLHKSGGRSGVWRRPDAVQERGRPAAVAAGNDDAATPAP